MTAKELAALVQSWRWREIGETDLCDRDDLAAAELDRLIHNARCDLDADFLERLARAFREVKKIKVNPHEKSHWALAKAYEKLKKECGPLRSTWHEVVELARKEFGLPDHPERTLQRIRREMRGWILPDRPPGPKSKKRCKLT